MKTLLFSLLPLLGLALAAIAQSGQTLKGKKVAILSTMGVERVELEGPRQALQEAGATVTLITPDGKPIRSLEFPHWSPDEIRADLSVAAARPADYDALYLPGGIINPDLLRMDEQAVQFVKDFAALGRPISSMCHGPSVLITAGLVKGKRITSWPSVKTDLINAGARWVDEPVVVDGSLVTSCNPGDIPSLNREMIKLFAGAKPVAASR